MSNISTQEREAIDALRSCCDAWDESDCDSYLLQSKIENSRRIIDAFDEEQTRIAEWTARRDASRKETG